MIKLFEPFDLSGKKALKSNNKREGGKIVQFKTEHKKSSFIARITNESISRMLMSERST